MKRILILATAISTLTVASMANAGSVRIENSDSSTHTIKLSCSGSSKSIEVRSSTTSTYTFHSSNSSCDIKGGSISFPSSTLSNGESWKIKSGKAKRN